MHRSGRFFLSLAFMALSGLCFSVAAQGGTQTVAAAASPASAAKTVPASGDFNAWVVTDIHYLAASLHDSGARYTRLLTEGDNKNIAMVDPLLDALAWSAVNPVSGASKPDCLIVTGDLTFNGELASHQELAARFKALAAAGVPVYVLPGNHDLNNPMASSFFGDKAASVKYATPLEFAKVYAASGFGAALSRDRESLSYLVEPRAGVRLLLLDSTYTVNNLSEGWAEAGGALSESTKAWIASCARQAASDGARLVVAMHHSLIDHNSMVNLGYTIEDGDDLVSFFAGLGVRYVLTGHTHIQDVAEEKAALGSIYDITTSALSVFPHNYGSLSVSWNGKQESIEYRSRRVDVASWARAVGSADARLTNFSQASESFFRVHSTEMMSGMIDSECQTADPASGIFQLTSSQVDRLLDLLTTINERFFTGTETQNASDLESSPDMNLLAQLPSGFLSEYIQTILVDATPYDNELKLR